MTVNRKKEKKRKPAVKLVAAQKPSGEGHLNFMAGVSYDVTNPLLRLMCMSASSFFGEPMYYKGQPMPKRKKTARAGGYIRSLNERQRKHLRATLNAIDDYSWRSLTPKQAMEKAIDEALAHDPEASLRWAVILRKEDNIRVTPQIILVRAANTASVKGTGLVRKYGMLITARADEPATQLAYQLEAFGKPIPNALKRLWADYLTGAKAYSLAKYRLEDRLVKTIDVANVALGKSGYGLELPIGSLLRGELKLGDSLRTWESILSGGGSWDEALGVMGHMALLRNIRNLLAAGIDHRWFAQKLVEGAATGKQLPFRYLSAYNANTSAPGPVLDAIEESLMISIGQLPRFAGRTLSLSDNSGSAHGTPVSELSTMTVAQIGNMMGVLTGMASDEGVAGVFGDKLKCFNIRKGASFFDQHKALNEAGGSIGGGTENGIWLALDEAIRERQHWDQIFIYSDMQAGHGGLYGTAEGQRQYKGQYSWPGDARFIDVAKLIATYRAKVNSKVNVFMVQIAGYEDTLVPEFYDRTFIMGGWSGNVIHFARKMIDIADGLKQ